MAQNTLDEKSKLTYDERRKILTQEKSNVTEHKTDEVKEGEEVKEESKLVSTVESSMKVEYTEDGIKLAYKGLVQEKEFHDKRLVDLKNSLKEAGEMTPELTKLKEDLQTIAKIDKVEKSKAEIESTEERLKIVNKEIKEIKEAVGSRLKLWDQTKFIFLFFRLKQTGENNEAKYYQRSNRKNHNGSV